MITAMCVLSSAKLAGSSVLLLKNGMASTVLSILYKLTNLLQQQAFACLLLLLGGNTRPHDAFSVMLPSLADLNVNHTAACTGKNKDHYF